MAKGISTEVYKGVRDFYPEDMFLENYLFEKMRQVAESFGFLEYNASILEPAELYRAKTGEEIVNEQTYTFTDRGGREVTMRPEMTPTLARMIAQKRTELYSPLRLYSIPNLFRYEKPQKGRLREHFQLNADLFGIDSIEADVEIITLSYRLMESLGAKKEDFEIRVNDRKITDLVFNRFELKEEEKQKVSKVIDKREKISKESFESALQIILKDRTKDFISIIDSNQNLIKTLGERSLEIERLVKLIEKLERVGITNVIFDQNLVRGFDYYTGFVFEIFDTNPENKRSLFGGGRYDEILEIFGKEKMPAVGFGAGDVTILDFLTSRGLIPEYKSPVKLYVCLLDKKSSDDANTLAQNLRNLKINVALDYTYRKVADQIKSALKQKIPYILCFGENEIKTQKYKVKRLSDNQEFSLSEEELIKFLREN